MSSEVGNDTESCHWPVENGAIQVADDIGTAFVASDDNEWAVVAWSHLAIESFLDLCLPNEDKGFWLEVVVADSILVVDFELDGSTFASFEDFGMNPGYLFLTLLEGDGSTGDEVGSRKY